MSQGFELRTLTFIDGLQPQLAQFIAKDNRGYDPDEYDAALFIEIAPAMEIHHMIDLALKATSCRLVFAIPIAVGFAPRAPASAVGLGSGLSKLQRVPSIATALHE